MLASTGFAIALIDRAVPTPAGTYQADNDGDALMVKMRSGIDRGHEPVKQVLKRKRKTIPALGAAGLSLTLASEASLAATAPALDTMARKAGVSHEIILREEEIFDITLASFYVFDK